MENIQEIFTDEINIPKDNMRQHIDRDEIFELGQDIKKNGLISPITVRPKIEHREYCEYLLSLKVKNCNCGASMRYEVVAGQRRYLAHQVMGILKIKCVVRELTDDEALAIMTSENLSRVDVNPIDEANHVARLMMSNNGDIKKVAHIVGRREQWVKDRLAVGDMPDYMQELLSKKEIKLGVALRLAQITDESTRKMWTFQAVRDGANVQLAEYWLADFRRRFLPGGDLADGGDEQPMLLPPEAVMLECSIDGQKYDARTMKALFIYEGNMAYFFEFVKAFRGQPSENALSSGGD